MGRLVSGAFLVKHDASLLGVHVHLRGVRSLLPLDRLSCLYVTIYGVHKLQPPLAGVQIGSRSCGSPEFQNVYLS